MKAALFFGGLFLGVLIGVILTAAIAVGEDDYYEEHRPDRNQDD